MQMTETNRRKELADHLLKDRSVITAAMRASRREFVEEKIDLWTFISTCNEELARVAEEQSQKR